MKNAEIAYIYIEPQLGDQLCVDFNLPLDDFLHHNGKNWCMPSNKWDQKKYNGYTNIWVPCLLKLEEDYKSTLFAKIFVGIDYSLTYDDRLYPPNSKDIWRISLKLFDELINQKMIRSYIQLYID